MKPNEFGLTIDPKWQVTKGSGSGLSASYSIRGLGESQRSIV